MQQFLDKLMCDVKTEPNLLPQTFSLTPNTAYNPPPFQFICWFSSFLQPQFDQNLSNSRCNLQGTLRRVRKNLGFNSSIQNNTLERAPGAPCASHVQDQRKQQDFNLTQSWGTTLRTFTAVQRQHFQNPKGVITHLSSLSHFTWTLHPIKIECWKKFQQHWDKKCHSTGSAALPAHTNTDTASEASAAVYFFFFFAGEGSAWTLTTQSILWPTWGHLCALITSFKCTAKSWVRFSQQGLSAMTLNINKSCILP